MVPAATRSPDAAPSELTRAIAGGDAALARRLLKGSPPENLDGALFEACATARKSVRALVPALLAAGARPEGADHTPGALHALVRAWARLGPSEQRADRSSFDATLDALASAGADLEQEDNEGYTPLAWATAQTRWPPSTSTPAMVEMVERLLGLGAKTDVGDGRRLFPTNPFAAAMTCRDGVPRAVLEQLSATSDTRLHAHHRRLAELLREAPESVLDQDEALLDVTRPRAVIVSPFARGVFPALARMPNLEVLVIRNTDATELAAAFVDARSLRFLQLFGTSMRFGEHFPTDVLSQMGFLEVLDVRGCLFDAPELVAKLRRALPSTVVLAADDS